MLRLVQMIHPSGHRQVAVVDEPTLRPLANFRSVHELALEAIRRDNHIGKIIASATFGEPIDYDAVYRGQSEWTLLPPIDHPNEPARCQVTGTGLTHKASAENRNSMHVAGDNLATKPAEIAALTDSMKMYRLGLEGGRPETGKIGAAPEWFYKGCGTTLKAH